MAAELFILDNYDSFTFNLVQMFRQYDLEIKVVRADRITVEEVERLRPDYILISPGPKYPTAAGISTALVSSLYSRVPILGVCLGMQCINEAFGGVTVRSPRPMHGKTSVIRHDNRGLFAEIPNAFKAARYHSLTVAEIPDALTVTATATDGVVMGLSHRTAPLYGVQFHPESFLTEHGFTIIGNFLKTGPLGSALK